MRAYSALHRDVKRGDIEKPDFCEQCGGFKPLHGHHRNGYNDALDVKWLCHRCHRASTPTNSTNTRLAMAGEKNRHAVLNENDVKFIRADVHRTNVELAEMFDVNPSTISNIRSGKTWRHV